MLKNKEMLGSDNGQSGHELRRLSLRKTDWLTAAPVEGKANKLLLEILSKHFGCRRSQLKIIKGQKSRNKLILIEKEGI